MYRLGAGYDFFDTPESPVKLTVTLEAIHPSDSKEKMMVGGELWLIDILALRGGYKVNYDEEEFTAGLGINYNLGEGRPIGIDFAWIDHGRFGNLTRFSLGIGF